MSLGTHSEPSGNCDLRFCCRFPFGGLFTGAEGIKTPEQAAVYGGTAGQQLDPCYHLACDTFDDISLGLST